MKTAVQHFGERHSVLAIILLHIFVLGLHLEFGNCEVFSEKVTEVQSRKNVISMGKF